jgi:SAM-dependent methyltransferase
MTISSKPDPWDEELSRTFMDYGRYFVPDRDGQIAVMVSLLPEDFGAGTVLELCCGEGLLAEAILARYPDLRVVGYDGSSEMRRAACRRLAHFGERFEARDFDLGAADWRAWDEPVLAVVTSLAVHHLEGPEKARLFRDIYRLLSPRGVFVIADVIDPAHPIGKASAGAAHDEVVRRQSLALDGDTRAFDFFQREGWNIFRYLDPDDIDKPSKLYEQLRWLDEAGFEAVDVFWMQAGHAIFGGWKP